MTGFNMVGMLTGGGDPLIATVNAVNGVVTAMFFLKLMGRVSGALADDEAELGVHGPSLATLSSREAIDDYRGKLRKAGRLRRRLESLSEVAQRGGGVQHDALSALAVADFDQELGLANHATGAAVLIGLFGTLLGLSVAVGQASSLVGTASSQPQFERLFGGLEQAFSAALVGVLCTVVLGWAVAVVRRRQSRYLMQLEEFTATRLLPYFQPSPATSLIQSANALTEMQATLDDKLRKLIGELQAQGLHLVGEVSGGLKPISASLSKLEREYAATHAVLSRILGNPAAAASSLSESLSVLASATKSSSEAASSIRDTLPLMRETLERFADQQTKDLHSSLKEHAERLQKLIVEQGETLRGVRSAVESSAAKVVGEAAARLVAPTDELAAAHRSLAGVVSELDVAVAEVRAELSRLRIARGAAEASVGPAILTPRREDDGEPVREASAPSLFDRFFGRKR